MSTVHFTVETVQEITNNFVVKNLLRPVPHF